MVKRIESVELSAQDKHREVATLSERQQKLLAGYFDNESSWLQRFQARNLLRRSSAAVDYIAELSDLRLKLSGFAKDVAPVDLWNKIEQRIVQEQRNAVYTRKNVASAVKGDRIQWLAGFTRKFSLQSLGFGFGAGAVSAALVLFVVLPKVEDAPGSPGAAGSLSQSVMKQQNLATPKNNAGFGPVTSISMMEGVDQNFYTPFEVQGTDFDLTPPPRSSSGLGRDYRAVSSAQSGRQRRVQAVEIDWVKSDGRLLVMRDAQESNPVIFVAPRQRNQVVFGGVLSQDAGRFGQSALKQRSQISRRASRAESSAFESGSQSNLGNNSPGGGTARSDAYQLDR